MSGKMSAIKVTLSTGKIVILRNLKISDTESAAQECSARSNGDANVLQFLMQKAMLKNLLLEIDGKSVSAAEREDLDGLFQLAEYTQLMSVIKEMSGGDELGKKPKYEVVSSGSK